MEIDFKELLSNTFIQAGIALLILFTIWIILEQMGVVDLVGMF